MKALALNIILVIISLLALLLLGYVFYTQITRENISPFLSSTFTGCGRDGQDCCLNNWCDTGLICSNNVCIEDVNTTIMIDERYLIYNPETATDSQRSSYFTAKSGLGFEDCSNANGCENCIKLSNFTNASNCKDCSPCESFSNNCKNCLSCDSADYDNDGFVEYRELYECYNCTGCNVNSGIADSCSQCTFCNVANKTTFENGLSYENGLSCSKCYQCEDPTNKCYSCYDCDMPNEKVCDNCSFTGFTQCKSQHDKQLCNKFKECIADYQGEPCQIEESLPMPAYNGGTFSSSFRNTLTNCIEEDIKKRFSEGVQQKICKYVNFYSFVTKDYISDTAIPNYASVSDMLTTSSPSTGENSGILFNDCGIIKPPYDAVPIVPSVISNAHEIFTSSTTPRTPENEIPVNLNVVVPYVSWNEQTTNECSFRSYVCAQEAIATSIDDPILNVYRFLTYFNESNYNFRSKSTSSYSNVGTDASVIGINYRQKFIISLKGRHADIQHIAKALVAGFRDYAIMNSVYNQTIEFFCRKIGLYSTLNECYTNGVSVVINDRAPWNLDTLPQNYDPISNVPYGKYIYYNSSYPEYNSTFETLEVNLTIFAFTKKNNPSFNNTIFISPVIILKPGECNDGIDNDDDSFIDYPNDPGCDSKADSGEDKCGNDVLEFPPEQCDGNKLGVSKCTDFGYTGGTLSCKNDNSCKYNYTNCTGTGNPTTTYMDYTFESPSHVDTAGGGNGAVIWYDDNGWCVVTNSVPNSDCFKPSLENHVSATIMPSGRQTAYIFKGGPSDQDTLGVMECSYYESDENPQLCNSYYCLNHGTLDTQSGWNAESLANMKKSWCQDPDDEYNVKDCLLCAKSAGVGVSSFYVCRGNPTGLPSYIAPKKPGEKVVDETDITWECDSSGNWKQS